MTLTVGPLDEFPETQAEAKKKGIKFYRGKPCERGHERRLRHTLTGCCVECARNYLDSRDMRGVKAMEERAIERELKAETGEVWDD